MKWNEVFKLHRKINALYFEGDKIKSVLFSQDRRRARINRKEGDVLYICLSDQIKTLELIQVVKVLKVSDIFNVFEKIAPDNWVDRGKYICTDISNGYDAINRQSLVITAIPFKEGEINCL